MTHYKIEKRIPIPEIDVLSPKLRPKAPLAEMKIGDSFAFPPEDRSRVNNAVQLYRGAKFTFRNFRVWRIK